MANNVLIDIDANYKQFEGALDELTAKVKSTAAQMDKAFAVSGHPEKTVKNTSDAVKDLHDNLKDISLIAAGNVLADGFEKALGKVKKFGEEIYNNTKRMQSLEMGMKSLVTSDLVKTGQVSDYTEATKQAEAETKKLMDWFKELSLKSPYELVEVMESFKQNANMGQSVETAKKTTEAILALGAGLGMGQAEMKRFSAALAQTGATGRITAMDLRQFANNGFGMDKMNAIFSELSEKYGVVIKDNNDFNKAVAEGKITTDAFFDALNSYALANYGNAVDAMASTIEGLKSSLGDIKVSAINDLFLEASKTLSKTIAPYVEFLMQMLTGGDFSKWGEGINKWAQGVLEPFQKIGAELENGNMMRAINSIRDFLTGKSMNLGAVKVMLADIGGEKFADEWIEKLKTLKGYVDRFLDHKDEIINAIKGIGIAFATAFAVKKLTGFISLLGQLNNPVTKLTLLGAALGVAWTKNLFGIREKSKEALTYIQGLIEIFRKDGINGVLEKIRTDVLSVFEQVKLDISNKFTEISTAFNTKGFKGVFDILVSDIEPILQNLWRSLPEGFKNKIFEIASKIEEFTAPIRKAIENVFSYFANMKLLFNEGGFGAVFSKLGADIQPILSGIWETIKTKGLEVIEFVKNKIKELIPESVRETLDKIIGVLGGVGIGVGVFKIFAYIQEALPTIVLIFNTIVDIGGWIFAIVGGIGEAISSVGFLNTAIGLLGSLLSSPVALAAALIVALVEGFAILGQFIDFGELIKNMFSIVWENIKNVANGIVEKVVPRLKTLWESIKGILVAIAPIGVALAGAVTSVGVLIVGVFNGIVKGLDDIIAVIIDVIDYVISIIRLPFDVVVGVVALIVGAITGNEDMMAWAVEHVVGRIKHIWEAFKNFWIDLWGFIEDFASGVWEVIVGFFESFDLEAGLGKVFGEEFVKKVEDFKAKVMQIFEDIKAGWLKMTGMLNGHTVNVKVGNERQDISGAAYDAFLKQNHVDEARYNVAHSKAISATGGGTYEVGSSEWRRRLTDEYNGTGHKAYEDQFGSLENFIQEAIKSYELSYEDMIANNLQSFYKEASDDIKKYYGQTANMKNEDGAFLSAKDRKALFDSYVSEKYSWAEEDPYLMSLLESTYQLIDNGVKFQEENTKALAENTGALEDETKETKIISDKPESSAFYTDEQISLWMKASDSLTAEFKDAVAQNKTYNTDAISYLEDMLANADNWSEKTFKTAAESYIRDFGMDSTTQSAVLDMLGSATDKETVVRMLDAIISVIHSEGDGVIKGIKYTVKSTEDQKKQNDEAYNDLIKSATQNRTSTGLSWNSGFSFDKDKYFEDPEANEELKKLNETIEAQNKQFGEALDKLDYLEKIEDLESEGLTKDDFNDAKESYLKALEESGISDEELAKWKDLVNKDTVTPEQLHQWMTESANIWTSNGVKISGYAPNVDPTEAYYNLVMDMNAYIKSGLKEALETVDKDKLNYAFGNIDIYNKNASQFSDAQYIRLITDSIENSGLPDELISRYSTLLNADGVTKDLAQYYVSELVAASREAGLIVANAENTTKQPSFSDNWSEELKTSWEMMYQDFLGGYENAINREMKATGKEREAVIQALGLDRDSFYNSSDSPNAMTTNLMNAFLPKINEAMGNKIDSFNHVTIDNWAEANEFLMDSEAWSTLYEDAMTGGYSVDDIMARMQSTLNGLMGEGLANSLIGGMKTELSTFPKSSQLVVLQGLMSLLNGEIVNLNTENSKKLDAIDTDVKKIKGNTTSGNAVVDEFDKYREEWRNTTDEGRKAELTFILQAMLDATGIKGENGNIIWSQDADKNTEDDVNRYNIATMTEADYINARKNMRNTGFSQSIFETSLTNMLRAQEEKDQAYRETQLSIDNVVINAGTGGEGAEGEGGTTTGGLLGLIFGNPEMYENLSNVLTPEVMAALQTLVGTVIDSTVTDSWSLFSSSLSVVSEALKGISASLVGEGGEDAAGAISQGLEALGESAETITPQLQDSLNPELDKMRDNLGKAYDYMWNIVTLWTGGKWKQAAETFAEVSSPAITAARNLSSAAGNARNNFEGLASAIENAIRKLQQWQELTGQDSVPTGPVYAAGGTQGLRYGTAIVGEHGPELITTGSTALNVFSNTQLMGEIAHTRHALNLLSNSAEMVAYNRLMGSGGGTSSTDNSQTFTNNFNGVMIGESDIREMIEEVTHETIGKELRLAR